MTTDTQVTPAVQPVAPPTPRRRAPVRRRGVALDPAARFGPVSGAIAYGLGVLAAGSVGDLAGIPAWTGLIIGGGLGIVAVIRAHFNRHTIEAKAARYLAWLVAGMWLFAVWQFGRPFNIAALVILAAMSCGGGQLAFVAKRKRDKAALLALEAARQAAANETEQDDPRAKEWRERIERVCNVKGIRIVGIEDWGNSAGFSVDGDCPEGGMNWRDVAGQASGLGSDAGLLNGCEVEVGPGVNQRAFVVDVPTRNAFAEEQPRDLDITPRSVLHGLDLGVLRNTSRATIPIREQSTVVVATTGAGKTTLLHRFVKQIGCCTDGMLGVADMNEGDIGRAWCQAWWDGKAPYPVVSWIAWDAEEAYTMALFSLGMAKGRKRRSGPLKRAANTSLMPIGNGAPGEAPPWWGMMFDESAELMGSDAKLAKVGKLDADEVAELIKRCMATIEAAARVARDAGVRHIVSALRAVDGFLPPGLLALTGNRIGLRMENDRDPGYLFGWEPKGGFDEEMQKGGGRYNLGYGKPTKQFQSPNILPNDIYELSVAIAEAGIGPWDLSPEDIADGEALAGVGAWTNRWARAEALFGRPRIDYDTKQPVTLPGTVSMIKPQEATMERDFKEGTLAGALEDLAGKSAALEAACLEAEAERAQDDEDEDTADIDDAWDEIVAGFEEEAPEPGHQRLDWRDRAVEIFKAVGASGAGPKWVAEKLQDEGFGTTRPTVSAWLNGPDRPACIVPHKLRRGRFRYEAS